MNFYKLHGDLKFLYIYLFFKLFNKNNEHKQYHLVSQFLIFAKPHFTSSDYLSRFSISSSKQCCGIIIRCIIA